MSHYGGSGGKKVRRGAVRGGQREGEREIEGGRDREFLRSVVRRKEAPS